MEKWILSNQILRNFNNNSIIPNKIIPNLKKKVAKKVNKLKIYKTNSQRNKRK